MAYDRDELVPVPRSAIRLPLALTTPSDFDPARPQTWPAIEGRLEYVSGRLLWMPPSGDEQQDTCVDVITVLNLWRRDHVEFRVGGNEAGMILGGDSRAADAAVWRAADLGEYTGGYRRVPPVLAVEVAGKWDDEEGLHEKASWYLAHGVEVVWLLYPRARRAVVLDATGETTFSEHEVIPERSSLPGLLTSVDDLFRQVVR
ncbi:MAG: Uma2 family endonuclease [Sandaracinaceae bacterium]